MMKKIISLLGIIMTFAVAMSVFVACGNESAGKTVERLTVEENTILVAESADDITLTVRIKYAGEDERAATGEDVEYSSDNTQVATVSKDGVVTVTGVGNTKLTVKSKSGGTTGEKLMETIDMTVVRDSSVVESLTVTGGTEQTATYKVDSTLQLETKIKYVGGAEKPATSADVTYTSSKPDIASVDSNGLVELKGIGKTEIVISSKKNGIDGNAMISVVNLTVIAEQVIVESLTVTGGTEQTATYKVDETLQLETKIKYVGGTEKTATNEDVTYVSSEPSIATVSSSGLVSVKAVGKTEITVSSIYNNASGAKVVKVITLNGAEPPIVTERLTLTSPTEYSVIRGIYGYDPTKGYENDKTQITFDVKYYYEDEERAGNSDEVTYTSGDPSVASVSDSGEITFNALGTCTITVTSKYKTIDGKDVSIEIPVKVYKPTNIDTGYIITGWEEHYYDPQTQTLVKLTIKNLTDEAIYIHETMYVSCLNTEGKVLDTLRFYSSDNYINANSEQVFNFLIDKEHIPEGTVEMVIVRVIRW